VATKKRTKGRGRRRALPPLLVYPRGMPRLLPEPKDPDRRTNRFKELKAERERHLAETKNLEELYERAVEELMERQHWVVQEHDYRRGVGAESPGDPPPEHLFAAGIKLGEATKRFAKTDKHAKVVLDSWGFDEEWLLADIGTAEASLVTKSLAMLEKAGA
jgi:hypothetical protein